MNEDKRTKLARRWKRICYGSMISISLCFPLMIAELIYLGRKPEISLRREDAIHVKEYLEKNKSKIKGADDVIRSLEEQISSIESSPEFVEHKRRLKSSINRGFYYVGWAFPFAFLGLYSFRKREKYGF